MRFRDTAKSAFDLVCGAMLSFAMTCSAASNDWWSLKPITCPSIPSFTNPVSPAANPIDAFIGARLAASGFTLAPEADRRTLIRRLYFDLIGLPPTPEEVDAFVNHQSVDAYERLTDRLLASQRHGERWARHWMDVAHFAETHGHDQDRIRENAWPYRDYLIASFNSDKTYARFVEEQVAGDALYPDDPQAIVALGFLASGPWDESSLRDIREDTIDRQIGRYLDRDDVVTTVMQTFTSTTVQCARCHDHKFDPVPQRDYYALQAVFAGVDKANRRYDLDPALHRRRRELQANLAAVERGDRALLLAESAQSEVAKWEGSLAREDAWRALEPETFVSAGGAILTRQTDRSILAGGPRPERDTYTITASSPLRSITAVRLEVLPDDSLPKRGPGRQDNGNLHLSEFQFLLFEPATNAARVIPLRNPSADFAQDGWGAAKALDGDEKTAWGIHPKVGERHEAVFELTEKLTLSPGAKLTFVLKQLHGGGHLIGRARLAVTDIEPVSRAVALSLDLRQILNKPPATRTEQERLTVAAFQQRAVLSQQLAALPKPSLIYAAASDFEPDGSHKPAGKPRSVHMLQRGDIRKPLEEALPGALACVAGLPARFPLDRPGDEATRRAALARWFTHPDNPLMWRSIVNRVWHYHFGHGLIDTPNDFGRMGGTPSHPELLDWLAVWFRDNGGSMKKLHRLIVTSATYRQRSAGVTEPRSKPNTRSTSDTAPPLQQSNTASLIDADNNLLWRANRTRLDAECVRDAVLSVAGQLDLRMGGPSDRQFDLQPGIHVTPRIDYAKFDCDSNAGRRRSVYRFLFRTLPDPMMDALDCPAGDQLTAARTASVTVQQALALWNSAFIARQCEHFATRLEREASGVDAQVKRAFELALCRPPTAEEVTEFADYARRHGLANTCRLLFNSNEFIFVN